MTLLTSERNIIVGVLNEQDEASIALVKMSPKEEADYLQLNEQLIKEYKNKDDLQFLICELLLERDHLLLLDCAETYHDLYFRMTEKYGRYNDAYFIDLATEVKQLSGISKKPEKYIITIMPKSGTPLPKPGTLASITIDSSNIVVKRPILLGIGTVRESSDKKVIVELTSCYLEFIMKDKTRVAGITENSRVTVRWQE